MLKRAMPPWCPSSKSSPWPPLLIRREILALRPKDELLEGGGVGEGRGGSSLLICRKILALRPKDKLLEVGRGEGGVWWSGTKWKGGKFRSGTSRRIAREGGGGTQSHKSANEAWYTQEWVVAHVCCFEVEKNTRTYTLISPPNTLHPTPYTLHPKPHTLHPTPHTLHPTPWTLGAGKEGRGKMVSNVSQPRMWLQRL